MGMIILSFLASEVGGMSGETCCGGRGGSSGRGRKIILDREFFLVGFFGDTRYLEYICTY